ncbi:trypsin-like serine peptidase [Streptomyces sp. NPDC048507]|uniref:trypsin-like serine peptidase n=1 Tax=Streptomyces sp. NPDC048507 TaxID=3365560 RepID=UPI0037152E14
MHGHEHRGSPPPPRQVLRTLLVLILVLLPSVATASATADPPAAAPAGSPPPTPASAAADDLAVARAEAFWTSEAMAAATPMARGGPGRTDGRTDGRTPEDLPRTLVPGPQPGPRARHFGGLVTVGILFVQGGDLRRHMCSASVVDSPGGSLILTAGHCATGRRAAFVPKYRTGASAGRQPYGIWPVGEWFAYDAYTPNTKEAASDLDFAFGRVVTNGGRRLQDVTGANALARTGSFAQTVTVVGYPATGNDPEDRAVRCTVRTGRLPGYQQMRVDCAGMWAGVSGGPWFSRIDEKTGRGVIVGNVGGYNGGGPDTPGSKPLYGRITYSPVHQDAFFALYQDAKNNRHGHRADPYRPPSRSFSLGSARTWRHARLLASGDYTGDGKGDVITVWGDGETTLYSGDGRGGFTAEHRLRPRNTTWTHAKTVTGGDFAGGDGSDLLVVWGDGEVSLYPDVTRRTGLGREITLAPRHSVWRKAEQVAGGSFGTTGHVTDLLVRWHDGEVTDHTGVGATGFGTEHRLRAPNALWKNASLVTTGDFTGDDAWDTLVRWSDGEVTQYRDTSPAGLGRETRMAPRHGPWTAATVMTAGSLDGNGYPDDLLVRWRDGETGLYQATGTRFGRERTLVAPPAP